jgi:hypothetical protein
MLTLRWPVRWRKRWTRVVVCGVGRCGRLGHPGVMRAESGRGGGWIGLGGIGRGGRRGVVEV